ncbi:MAG: Xaa-Pro aminopeptidase [Clostridia bacterium]|nr:Xaa-Pro aminopeptidase [Clostridia bacterium]
MINKSLSNRLIRLRQSMLKEDIEAIWICQLENCRYLSNFTGDSGQLLITHDNQYLLTDGRFIEQAQTEAPDFKVIDLGKNPWEQLGKTVASSGVKKLHFEAQHVTYATYQILSEKAKSWQTPVSLVPSKGIVENLRLVKDENEIKLLQKAIDIGDAGFKHILKFLRPGVSERDIALELEYFLGKLGSSGPSFATIIASGPRSALPHGVASERVLQPGDLVVMDFGAIYNGYHSDLTRTVALGPVAKEWREIYNIVLTSQLKAIDAIRSDLEGKYIDSVARDYITNAGYGEYFTHSLGHGVGLAVHEGPTLSGKSDIKLSSGMIVTVEPGIYLPGQGGIRIEDVVMVQEDKVQVLSKADKEFIEL